MRNGYVIRRVDGLDRKTSTILKRLQRRVDPESVPCAGALGQWWLVYYQDKPIAFAGIRAATKTPNAGYMARSGVLARHRGNGLQRTLLRLRLAYARTRGWDAVVTDTISGNHHSANNLIACGFRLYEPAVRWNPHDPHALYWRRRF